MWFFFPLCSLVGSEVSDSLGPPHIGVSLRQSHRQKGCRISCTGSWQIPACYCLLKLRALGRIGFMKGYFNWKMREKKRRSMGCREMNGAVVPCGLLHFVCFAFSCKGSIPTCLLFGPKLPWTAAAGCPWGCCAAGLGWGAKWGMQGDVWKLGWPEPAVRKHTSLCCS